MRVPVPAIVTVFVFGIVAACSSGGGGGGPSAVAREVDFSVAPGATFTGAAIAPAIKVEVKDTDGTVVTSSSASVGITLIGAPGALGGTTTRNAVAGVATFADLTISAAGDYQLVAASGALAKDTTALFTVTDPPPSPDSVEVLVGNASGGIVFRSKRNSTQNPAVDSVAIGGKVHWTWLGSVPHSVLSTGSPSFTSSGTSGAPFAYDFVFANAGTYRYVCAVHGTGMTGRVVVR
jgi:plastocyanin